MFYLQILATSTKLYQLTTTTEDTELKFAIAVNEIGHFQKTNFATIHLNFTLHYLIVKFILGEDGIFAVYYRSIEDEITK